MLAYFMHGNYFRSHCAWWQGVCHALMWLARHHCAPGVRASFDSCSVCTSECVCIPGLDSTTAMHVLEILRQLAQGGRAIITTIHQPSSRLFQTLDKLLLLSQVLPSPYSPSRVSALGTCCRAVADDAVLSGVYRVKNGRKARSMCVLSLCFSELLPVTIHPFELGEELYFLRRLRIHDAST